jgi:hypothetical protein
MPSSEEKKMLLEKSLEVMPRPPLPDWLDAKGVIDWSGYADNLLFQINRKMNRGANPGIPWLGLAKNNAELFRTYPRVVFGAIMIRAYRLSKGESLGMTTCQLVESGLMDPARLMTKGELHSSLKMKQRRFRQIANLSVVDQQIQQTFCRFMNSNETQHFETLPVQVGLGLDDEPAIAFRERVLSHKEPVVATDMSSFDFTVQKWCHNLMVVIRLSVLHLPLDSPFGRALAAVYHNTVNAAFMFPDGSIVRLALPGIVSSGGYNTGRDNSWFRYWLALLIGCKWAYTMGDDCLEQEVPDAMRKYRELGFLPKEPTIYPVGEDFDFLSHVFTDRGPVPLRMSKCFFKLLDRHPPTSEMIESQNEMLLEDFKYFARNHDDLDAVVCLYRKHFNVDDQGARRTVALEPSV